VGGGLWGGGGGWGGGVGVGGGGGGGGGGGKSLVFWSYTSCTPLQFH